jgi:hypothetical protein
MKGAIEVQSIAINTVNILTTGDVSTSNIPKRTI